MHRRHLGLAVLAAAGLHATAGRAGSPAGSPTVSAGDFIRQLGRDLPGVLGNATTDAEKRRRLEPFLARVVDVEAVARFCLGRYWRQATPAQQQDYRQLFLRVLANAVASRVGAYGAGSSRVTVLADNAEPDGLHVPTVVQTGDAPAVRITWLLESAADAAGAGAFRILDVQAEGSSMRLSRRSDDTAVIARNGGDLDLVLRMLRAHTP
jgi:phospholipid transport system substrate-binding protein